MSQIEVLVDRTGKIVALNAAHPGGKPARRLDGDAVEGEPSTVRPPFGQMKPRADQARYLVTLPAGLEGMSFKEIHNRFRLIHDGNGPRLERIETATK
jgi:hypothetical protein